MFSVVKDELNSRTTHTHTHTHTWRESESERARDSVPSRYGTVSLLRYTTVVCGRVSARDRCRRPMRLARSRRPRSSSVSEISSSSSRSARELKRVLCAKEKKKRQQHCLYCTPLAIVSWVGGVEGTWKGVSIFSALISAHRYCQSEKNRASPGE